MNPQCSSIVCRRSSFIQQRKQPVPITQPNSILVTGATGYVGGRLVPRLLAAGYRVRLLARGGDRRFQGRPWLEQVEIVDGDVLQPQTLAAAMVGIDVAYYLIHSMGSGDKFRQRDKDAAANFANAAKSAGVRQLIYLGGLGDSQSDLSEHLQSRQETGDALRSAGLPVTEFQAGMVVGSGSLSFEMLRHLTERLPVMICPSWVYTRTQPIAIRDVLSYLLAALEKPECQGRTIEIGGATVLSYGDMMRVYARQRGLHRLLIPVPFFVPPLSAHWVHWMTPISLTMAQPLIKGLRNELVVRSAVAKELFPAIVPLDFETAVKLAIQKLEAGDIETLWSDALASSNGDIAPVYFAGEQGMLFEHREKLVKAPAATVYRTFAAIGGKAGWPAYDWLWGLRGLADRLVGGVGMRRGRRHPQELRVGEALDFWRVEEIEHDHYILLRAEMKLPGKGWLRFEANPTDDPTVTKLTQTAFFAPKGLFGLLYWYSIYPIHGTLFSKMIDKLAEKAEEMTG